MKHPKSSQKSNKTLSLHRFQNHVEFAQPVKQVRGEYGAGNSPNTFGSSPPTSEIVRAESEPWGESPISW